MLYTQGELGLNRDRNRIRTQVPVNGASLVAMDTTNQPS